MAIRGIKITDLPETTNIPDNGHILLSNNNANYKLTTSSFFRTFSGIKQASNLSNGIGIYKNTVNNTLFFNTLTSTGGIDITLSNNLVTLDIKNNSIVLQKLETTLQTLISNLSSRMVTLESMIANVNTQLLLGSIIPFATTTTPSGFLHCNGDVISSMGTVQGIPTAQLQTLRTFLGTKFGLTLGTLPDLRGEFIRGWDNSRGIDVGRQLGSSQLDSMQKITGSFIGIGSARRTPTNSATGVFLNDGVTNNTMGISFGIGGDKISFDSSRQVRTSTETRPRNIALMYCIKY
jgi:microcystin-dependent protein